MPHEFSIRNMVSNLTRPVAHKVLTEALIIVSEYNLQKRQFNEIPKHNLKLISIREKEDINYYSNKYKNESAKKNAEHAWINMMSRCYNENSVGIPQNEFGDQSRLLANLYLNDYRHGWMAMHMEEWT